MDSVASGFALIPRASLTALIVATDSVNKTLGPLQIPAPPVTTNKTSALMDTLIQEHDRQPSALSKVQSDQKQTVVYYE